MYNHKLFRINGDNVQVAYVGVDEHFQTVPKGDIQALIDKISDNN